MVYSSFSKIKEIEAFTNSCYGSMLKTKHKGLVNGRQVPQHQRQLFNGEHRQLMNGQQQQRQLSNGGGGGINFTNAHHQER